MTEEEKIVAAVLDQFFHTFGKDPNTYERITLGEAIQVMAKTGQTLFMRKDAGMLTMYYLPINLSDFK